MQWLFQSLAKISFADLVYLEESPFKTVEIPGVDLFFGYELIVEDVLTIDQAR